MLICPAEGSRTIVHLAIHAAPVQTCCRKLRICEGLGFRVLGFRGLGFRVYTCQHFTKPTWAFK